MLIIKEVCVDSLSDAMNAEKNGANRIELCSRLDKDGLTPSRKLIKDCFNLLKIPIKSTSPILFLFLFTLIPTIVVLV